MRLINADALRSKAQWMEMPDRQGINFDVRAVSVSSIDLAPTIDAVPVVRCRDCERRDKLSDLTDTVYCLWYLETMYKDDYCSYGKLGESDETK